MTLRLHGLIAAPHTPMLADGGVRFAAVEQQAAMLIAGGVSAAFVCGTTGEGASLTSAERMRLTEQWVDVTPPALAVIAHVGHTSLAEACALASHAQSAGAQAVSALAPYFFKPRGISELVDFCAQVAGAAESLPFYFYHIPSMTGVALSMTEFLLRARDAIPTFAGIKYTHYDLMEYQQCIALAGGELDILFGRDEMLLAGLAAGAVGAIGSTYNYASPVYHGLIAAFRAGDLPAAREFQSRALRLVEVLRRYGEIPAAKAIMSMMGVDCGPPRAPLPKLSAEQRGGLYRDLEGLADLFVRPLHPIG